MEEPNVATPVNGLLPLQQRRLLLILPPGLRRAPNGLVCRLPNLVQCVQAFAPRAKPGVIRRQAQCWLQEDGVAIGAVPALLWLIAGVHIDTEWWAQTVHVWDAQLAAAAGSAVIDVSDDSDAEAEAGAMQRLQARVVQLEGMNLALTGKLRKAGKQIWHLKRKVGKLTVTPSTQPLSFEVAKRSDRDGAWLTPASVHALALRKSLAHVSSNMLGAVLLVDLHASTVSRCEFRSASALLRTAHSFFQQICLSNELGSFSFAQHPWLLVCAVRSDATNSSVWQRSKLMGTQIDASYLTAMPDDSLAAPALVTAETKTFADQADGGTSVNCGRLRSAR